MSEGWGGLVHDEAVVVAVGAGEHRLRRAIAQHAHEDLDAVRNSQPSMQEKNKKNLSVVF